MENDKLFLLRAIELASDSISEGGGPFGAVIVKDNKIISEASNRVVLNNDPTAHAEILAIRQASSFLISHELNDCTLYSSCEPCPMCLGAIYWARPARVYYANTRSDAAAIGFDDDFIYHEINPPLHQRTIPFEHLAIEEAKEVFHAWKNKQDRIDY